MYYLIILFTTIAVNVKFKSSSYSVDEVATAVLMLMLSDKSSTDINLQVNNNDITATGMCSLLVLGGIPVFLAR